MFPLWQGDSTDNEKLRVLQTFCVPLTRWKNWTKSKVHETVPEQQIAKHIKKYKKKKRDKSNTVQTAVYNFVTKQGPLTVLNTQNYWNYREHYTQHKIAEFEVKEVEEHETNSVDTDEL